MKKIIVFTIVTLSLLMTAGIYSCKKNYIQNVPIESNSENLSTTAFQIKQLSVQFKNNFRPKSKVRWMYWAGVACADLGGVAVGAELGTFCAGPGWGTAGGAVLVGAASSIGAARIFTWNNTSMNNTFQISFNTSNPYEYLGVLHNNILTSAYNNLYSLYDSSNPVVFNNAAANLVIDSTDNYFTVENSFSYSSCISQDMLTVEQNNDYQEQFFNIINGLKTNNKISDNEHSILTDFANSFNYVNNLSELNIYCDSVINFVANSTTLNSNEKEFLLTTLSIGKYSAMINYHNFN